MKNKQFILLFFLILNIYFIVILSCKKTKTAQINRDLLEKFPWFLKNYKEYKIDEENIKKIKTLFNENLKIVIFLGIWCPDSHREVPALLKILDYLKFNQVKIFNLDKSKKGPKKEEEKYKIDYLPTFILYKKNKEIGRIIESPKETLEKDLFEIFLKK